MDLDTSELLLTMRPQHYEIICYHCQQSAEKYFKGYLIFNGIVAPPKIHDLVDLNKRCFEFEPLFTEILDECEILTQYGVQPRYPDEIYMDENLMKKALDCARKIKEFAPLNEIRRKLEESMK